MTQPKTLPELLNFVVSERPDATAYWSLDTECNWQSIDYKTLFERVCTVTSQLAQAGLSKGQAIGIMMRPTIEWEIIHHAILMLGGTVVGIDSNEASENLSYIFETAEIKTIIVDSIEFSKKSKNSAKENIRTIIANTTRNHSISLVLDNDQPQFLDSPVQPLKPIEVYPDDIATVIFTSGTTGAPKGIPYKHRQVIIAVDSILNTFPQLCVSPCKLVCWLPLSNLFQRIVNLCSMSGKGEIYFIDSPRQVIENLPTINPHIFIAVPRFYEKLNNELERRINTQPKPISLFLRYCLTKGENNSFAGSIFRLINKVLFKSFARVFGKNIQFLISGSASTPLGLLKRFYSLNLLILEAYGMSENIIPIASNRKNDYRYGSVGKCLKGNTIKLSEDGELLVKGAGVFSGYLGERTNQSLTNDGYLPTGDFAEISQEGFIRLTGRKSDIFKTSTGRKISPIEIEAKLNLLPEVDQSMVIGQNRKLLTAIITLDQAKPGTIEERQKIVQKIANDARNIVQDLSDYKRPAGMIVCFHPFSVASSQLTNNLKLRRQVISSDFKEYINSLYEMLEQAKSIRSDSPTFVNPDVFFVII